MAVLKEIQKVIGDVEAVALCPRCEGSGKVWSELDFGDIPGDEVQYDCSICGGSGRTKVILVKALVTVPFNFKFEGEI